MTAVQREELAREVAKKIDKEILGEGDHYYDQKTIFYLVDSALVQAMIEMRNDVAMDCYLLCIAEECGEGPCALAIKSKLKSKYGLEMGGA